jgi:L-fuconate dehydratase
LNIVCSRHATKPERIADLETGGYSAYSTSVGWMGYDDDKLRRLCREALVEGYTHMKVKVGGHPEDDLRRCRIIREEIGPDLKIMLDANQVWDVDEAIENMKGLAEVDPWRIEEPTNPDDILGHAKIARAVAPIGVATGEACQNRVMFKQFMQADAIEFCQVDSCRMAGVSDVIAVLLMAAKFNIKVCPHAGGVGLCEYVQHLAMIDYICISGTMEDRVVEYVDHLHEHFIEPVMMRNGRYIPPHTNPT